MGELRILSIIPPMTQLNTPYPSTAYLTGFLRSRGFVAQQTDLSIALALRLLSTDGIDAIGEQVKRLPTQEHTPATFFFQDHLETYRRTIAPAIRFLQGRDPSIAHRIASRRYLPEGPRFAALERYLAADPAPEGDALAWAFGALGLQDRAKHVATLFLNDLADVIRDAVDPRFEFVRYAESLAASQPVFDDLQAALAMPDNVVDSALHELTLTALSQHAPTLVLITAPFPGNVYGAFRIAQTIKRADPTVVTVLGGGYCNTELRSMNEPRVFDYFDFVVLDAGERPLLALIDHLQGKRPGHQLVRTYTRGQYVDHTEPEIGFSDSGTPTYDGLPMDSYLSLLDMLNPMHRLWSDGRWNKLTVAHGCYWKQCSFCDVTLDYISRYDVAKTDVLLDRIESLIRETGQTGFHFVDEAAPPKALKSLAEGLLKRQLGISWWGNIRFEKSFDAGLCRLLADSGCIAVTGGLEVASDRLLKLMKKGVSVGQVARVTRAFSDAGVLVHAYLMYGFPTQTAQDTVDALEYVRQLFAAGCIQSGFFHRFTCTVHSPVGKHPAQYGVTLLPAREGNFARNDIAFVDATGIDHDEFGDALKKALYNYMHGIGLDLDVREWFDTPAPPRPVHLRSRRSVRSLPRTTVPPNLIEQALG